MLRKKYDAPVYLDKGRRSQKPHLSDKKKLTAAGMSWLTAKHLIILFICLIILFPIVYLLITAFNGGLGATEVSNGSYQFSGKNFTHLFSGTYEFWGWLINSLVIALVCMVLVVGASGFIAYGFSRYKFTGKKTFLVFILVIGLIPNVIALVVYYVLSTMFEATLGLTPLVLLTLIYASGGIIGNIYILKTYMDGISGEIDDSAKIDGLSNWQLFTRIIAPLAKPMLSIVAFWAFLAPFGDFILSSILINDPSQYTLPVGLIQMTGVGAENVVVKLISYPTFAAAGLIVAVPMVTVFLILQRNMRAGLADGGVKG